MGWLLCADCMMTVVGRLYDDCCGERDDCCGETVGWLLWGDCGMIVVGRLWDDWSEQKSGAATQVRGSEDLNKGDGRGKCELLKCDLE